MPTTLASVPLTLSLLLLAAGCGNPAPGKGTTTGAATASGTSGAACQSSCPGQGQTQCANGLIVTCGKGSNGCLTWGPALACPSGMTCTGSSCQTSGSASTSGAACTHPCPADGATQCSGAQIQICHSSGTCLVWSVPQTCSAGRQCGGQPAACVPVGSTTSSSTTSGASSTSGTATTGGSTSGATGCTDLCFDGDTQCSGTQVQTCGPTSAGCLDFSAPAACPAGQLCDSVIGGCQPLCQVSAVVSGCDTAAATINPCCAGSLGPTSGAALCALEVSAGNDPQAQCTTLAGQTCAAIAAEYVAVSTCCCPAGQYCDESTSAWSCSPSCTSNAACAGLTARPSCAPNNNGAGLVDTPYLCQPDDAAAFHGCTGSLTNCSGSYDCWTNGHGEFCTLSCNVDADCGQPGVACCDTTATCSNSASHCNSNPGVSCGTFSSCAGACVPCGI